MEGMLGMNTFKLLAIRDKVNKRKHFQQLQWLKQMYHQQQTEE